MKKTKKPTKKWSARVTKTSDAMALKKGVFQKASPKAIARSVKNSAARSTRRKSTPKQSAMSMLSFYANRAGKNLSPGEKKDRKGEGRTSPHVRLRQPRGGVFLRVLPLLSRLKVRAQCPGAA